MSDYQRGYDEGRNAHDNDKSAAQLGKGIGTLIGGAFLLGTWLVVEGLIAAPFLLVGFIVMAPLDFLGPTLGTGRLIGMGIVAYFTYAALYWLKGVVIAMSRREGKLWLLPFTVCVALTCLLPGWLVQVFIARSFPTAAPAWSWGLGFAFVLFAYSRYRFTEDTAPKLALWSYRRGYHWSSR